MKKREILLVILGIIFFPVTIWARRRANKKTQAFFDGFNNGENNV